MPAKIAIGIPTYNGAERVDWLLRSISLRTPWLASGDAEIVLVDDGSPGVAATRQIAERWSKEMPLRYIEHGRNRGISAGWNTATRASSAPLVTLVNDDVIVSKGWLEAFAYALDKSAGVGVVGASWHAFTREDVPGLLASADSDRSVVPRDPGTKAQSPERRALYEDTWPGRVMCPTGELFAFRRADFDAIGGFDETYLSMYEESCFGTSMAARGLIGLQLTEPFCFHMWSATFASSPELRASERLAASRAHYRRKWQVPEGVHEFEYTNPKYLGAIGDTPIGFLRRNGPCRGVLRADGTFVEG
jgi:GT2 family glycosyltransferase